MAYGDGGIQEVKRKDGSSYAPKKWRVCITSGVDPISGRRMRKTRTVRGSKADARRARDELRREIEGGPVSDAEKLTFGEFAHEWIAAREASGELAEQTLLGYATQSRVLCEIMGHVELRGVSVRVVESALAAVKAKRGITNTTLRHYYTFIDQVMKAALARDLIARNPCDRMKPPRLDPVERRSLTQEEGVLLLAALDAAEAEEKRAVAIREARAEARGAAEGRVRIAGLGALGRFQAVRIGIATGMRLGEVCALRWDAVDLESGRIFVVRSITRSGAFKAPKSRAGVRTVSLDSSTVSHLRRWKREQAALLSRMGMEQKEATAVCCSEVGGYLRIENVSHWWRKWSDGEGFEGLCFHELRHTQATQLLARGVDVKTVQARLGHSAASLTLDLYAHAMPENDREAADLIGEVFSEKSPNPAESRGFKVLRTA